MDERDDDALHAAFQELLGSRPEPPLPSVVDAAVTGGRRIRRRRVVLAAASTLAVVACTVAVATTLSGPDAGHSPRPVAPAATPPARPGPTTAAPEDGRAQPAEGTATGGGAAQQDSTGGAEPAHTGAQRSGDG
ncbi:hypothetical protein [Streptomyces adelaidensis]|uniref:hypothetical protein n=1 Tax=Streptomyces adelaidensis TaxID=2796465 RepID=UPI0019056325|nr:hypothetical protein [Streptomyces adelaidensis]